jgi:hypothetical protein
MVMTAINPNTRPIKFSATVDDAMKIAQKKNRPFFIFFCSSDVGSTAGEDNDAYKKYRAAHNNEHPHWTVFDCPLCCDIMRKNNIVAFVKIPRTKENLEAFRKYDAKENLLLICKPDGTSILGTAGDSHIGMVALLEEACEKFK